MGESTKNSRIGIWWDYIKSEKHVYLVFLTHIIISGLFIVFFKFSYDFLHFPAITLMDVINKIKDMFDLSKKVQAISISSALAFLIGIINCFFKLCNSRYDFSFMSYVEQKKQKFIALFIGVFAFEVIFLVVLLFNIFNVLSLLDEQTPWRLFFVLIELALLIGYVLFNAIAIKDNGRDEIITISESLFIVTLLVFYPIEEGSFLGVVSYSIFMLIMTRSIMRRLHTLSIEDTALYYFYEKNDKMFIHYRLDDYRVVCSKEAVLRIDSKRILFDISSLCKRDIRNDARNSNKNWEEAISRLKELKKRNRNKIKITTKIRNTATLVKEKVGALITKNIEIIQKKITTLKEKHNKINMLKAEVQKNKSLARKWEDDYKAQKKDNKKLQAEIEKFKKQSKCNKEIS